MLMEEEYKVYKNSALCVLYDSGDKSGRWKERAFLITINSREAKFVLIRLAWSCDVHSMMLLEKVGGVQTGGNEEEENNKLFE